jgi:NTE family protein
MYGLVFAGGGVRGAYEVGVWKALDEMKIKVSAVTGASIGAINAALFAQKSFKLVHKLWREIAIDDIIELPSDVKDSDNLFDIKNIVKISKEIYKNDGINMSPLRALLTQIINEDKIRKSPIDFGCTAYSITERAETNVFKADIPHGKLVDYLMASASILSVKEIGSKKFTDGGISNNMPINMLIEKGCRDIIAVNVRGAGIYKNINTAGCNIINIKCSEPMTGIMDFDNIGIEKSIALGYLDCLKIFGKLEGESYYIKKNEKNHQFSPELISGLEKAAEAFGVDKLTIYTLDELVRKTMKAYSQSEKITDTPELKESRKLIPWLIDRLEGKSNDFVKSKLEIFGADYEAASSILYFKRKLG